MGEGSKSSVLEGMVSKFVREFECLPLSSSEIPELADDCEALSTDTLRNWLTDDAKASRSFDSGVIVDMLLMSSSEILLVLILIDVLSGIRGRFASVAGGVGSVT